jgi:hypothetical protein
MYIYIQEKLAPDAAGAPQRSAVLEIPAGLVVGVYYDDPFNKDKKIAVEKPNGAPDGLIWKQDEGLVDARLTFQINFVEGVSDTDPNKLSFKLNPSPPDGAVLGGKKRRYHGKTKKSRR